MRTEYGFSRTTCSCRLCQIPCEHMPGALAPNDVARIAKHLNYGDDITKFARENLLASPGPTIVYRGKIMQLPTLVPARQPNGSCKFYENGRCSIHEHAPFGCAFFDMHDRYEERAQAGAKELFDEHQRSGAYSKLVADLATRDLLAISPSEGRRRVQAAIEREQLEEPRAAAEERTVMKTLQKAIDDVLTDCLTPHVRNAIDDLLKAGEPKEKLVAFARSQIGTRSPLVLAAIESHIEKSASGWRGIPFTQFIRPNGQPKPVWISRPDEIETKAREILEAGGRFEIEMLQDGNVSMEVLKLDECISGRLCDNGVEVPPTVDELVTEAHDRLVVKAGPTAAIEKERL